MNVKCTFGFHRWGKLGGAHSMGNGKFEQRLICTVCKKIKYRVS